MPTRSLLSAPATVLLLILLALADARAASAEDGAPPSRADADVEAAASNEANDDPPRDDTPRDDTASLPPPVPRGVAEDWWRVDIGGFFYFDNSEYVNIPFREGETLFGFSVTAAFTWLITDGWELSLGAFAQLNFGEEDFLEPINPYMRFRFQSTDRAVTLNFGSLDTYERHGMYDQMYVRQREFTLQSQYGFQAIGDLDWFDGEFFVDWQLLNTPDHRERFEIGMRAQFLIANLVELSLRGMWTHEGGQLFAVGPLTDNLTAQAGAALVFPCSCGHANWRIGASMFLSNDEPDRGDGIDPDNGWGLLFEVVYELFPTDDMTLTIGASLWDGNDWGTEVGNRTFRFDEPTPYLTVGWVVQPVERLEVVIYGEFFYFSRPEQLVYATTLAVRYNFEISGN